MRQEPELLKIQPDIIVNFHNVAYIELTGQGGMDIHFVGKPKPLHLKASEAELLRDYVGGESEPDVGAAKRLQVVHRRKGL